MFSPLRTARLLIRPFGSGDAASLAERRNDPAVAKYQNWTLPFTLDQAEKLVSGLQAMEGPTNDEWWMAIVAKADSGETVGDLALNLTWDCRTAEIGYTFATRHQGKGYAGEAVAELVRHLFDDIGVTRVFGMLHPENSASAMVLERAGMLFEGHTRSSFWLDGEVSDDWYYGMTRSDWEVWRDRPRLAPADVGLVDVTADNWARVLALRTHKSQEAFVPPVLVSLADMCFPPPGAAAVLEPSLRAIVADGAVVGAVITTTLADDAQPYLWRLLIDRLHQRRTIGTCVLDLLAGECRAKGAGTLRTSWVEGKGSPARFMLSRGFEPTGRGVDGSVEAVLRS